MELVEVLLSNGMGMLTTQDQADDARFPLAMLLSNVLRTGYPTGGSRTVLGERHPVDLDQYIAATAVNHQCSRMDSPYYKVTIQPLLELMDKILHNPTAARLRPRQPGDEELQALLDRALTTIFQF